MCVCVCVRVRVCVCDCACLCVCLCCRSRAQSAEAYTYLTAAGATAIPHWDDREHFSETLKAFETIGVTPEQQAPVFHLLSAILHLGNVTFAGTRPRACVCAYCVSVCVCECVCAV